MMSNCHYDRLPRDLDRDIAHRQRYPSRQPPQKPPALYSTAHFFFQVLNEPLTVLLPCHIPLGHLALLDAAPGSGLSLVAITLAACSISLNRLPPSQMSHMSHLLKVWSEPR